MQLGTFSVSLAVEDLELFQGMLEKSILTFNPGGPRTVPSPERI